MDPTKTRKQIADDLYVGISKDDDEVFILVVESDSYTGAVYFTEDDLNKINAFVAKHKKENEEEAALGDLTSLADDTPVMKFGKHKGKQYARVPRSYLLWCLDQEFVALKYPTLFNYALVMDRKGLLGDAYDEDEDDDVLNQLRD